MILVHRIISCHFMCDKKRKFHVALSSPGTRSWRRHWPVDTIFSAGIKRRWNDLLDVHISPAVGFVTPANGDRDHSTA